MSSLYYLALASALALFAFAVLCLRASWTKRGQYWVVGGASIIGLFTLIHGGHVPRHVCPKVVDALQEHYAEHQSYPATLDDIPVLGRSYCHYKSLDRGSRYEMTFHSGGERVSVYENGQRSER